MAEVFNLGVAGYLSEEIAGEKNSGFVNQRVWEGGLMEELAAVLDSRCDECLDFLLPEEIDLVESFTFCKSCYARKVIQCASCSRPVFRERSYEVREERVCGSCLDDHYRCCEGCGEYVHEGSARYSELRGVDYCERCQSTYIAYCCNCDTEVDRAQGLTRGDHSYCEQCYEEAEDDDELIQQHEFSSTRFRRCRSKRKYGVEIEAILGEGLEDHIRSTEVSAWSKQRDGSLGDEGMEFASPILQGDDGFKEIERFTGKLQGRGYVVDRRCGLHVHIDGRDLTYQDIKKLLKIALTFESVIYAMLPPSCYAGTYSVPLARFPKSRLKSKVADEESLKRLWYGKRNMNADTKSKYHNSRYFGVNIHSWFFRRSIEFRYHSGTLNPEKITNFIAICQKFVDKASKLEQARLIHFQNFHEQYKEFVRFLKLPRRIASYVETRIKKFHPEKLENPAIVLASV